VVDRVNSGELIELDGEEGEESAGLCRFMAPVTKTSCLGLGQSCFSVLDLKFAA